MADATLRQLDRSNWLEPRDWITGGDRCGDVTIAAKKAVVDGFPDYDLDGVR